MGSPAAPHRLRSERAGRDEHRPPGPPEFHEDLDQMGSLHGVRPVQGLIEHDDLDVWVRLVQHMRDATFNIRFLISGRDENRDHGAAL